MKPAAVVRWLPRTGDALFASGALLVCLAIADVLPRRLEALSQTKLVLLPAVLAFAILIWWLSLVRPRTAFIVGFSLLGLVQIQPAPVDVAFALLMIATLVTMPVRPQIPAFVLIPLAAFIVLTLLSMTNAVDISRAISFEAITLYMVGLAVWLSWAFTQREWVQAAVKTYIIVTAVCAATASVALYVHFPASHLLVFDDSRAMGFFKDPNVYSAFLVPSAVFLLEEFTTPRILHWQRRTIVALFAVVSIGVIVAYSRAAWLDYGVGIVVLLLVQASRRGGLRRAFRSFVVLSIGGALGFIVLLETGSLSFLQERSHLQGYDSQRFSNQATAFDAMTRHVFGSGPGQTEILLPISTHSSYIRAAFEQGLPGLVCLVLMFGGTALCALLAALRTTHVNGVGTAALLGIWLGQIANGFFIDTLHWRHLWIIAALVWCSYCQTTTRRTTSRQPALSSQQPALSA